MRAIHVLTVYVILLTVGTVLVKVTDYQRKKLLTEAAKQSAPDIPDEPPEPSQESIDKAMQLYSIVVSDYVDGPYYDATVKDRGITFLSQGSWKTKTVLIGPAAFESWALLGSTLGHEIEVHANQSFYKASFKDMVWFGTPGTDEAEREAYAYELRCSKRFGLSKEEVESIKETVNYYYPKEK